jgi:pyridinium-3,5-biscarboxylic acid mononucleotide sulfurtransferase
MSEGIQQLADSLIRRLRSYGPVAVAFSGGVDSAVVAKAAVLALQERAVAVTAVSPSLAATELAIARQQAALIGIQHVELSTDEFSRDAYLRNSADRCFHCKDTLYSLAATKLRELNVDCMVNGANIDDLGDHRPGMQAATKHDVRSPLIEEGLNKESVRGIARCWNLIVAEKPASPCLSSRIAYGVEVTEARVHRVELAEAFLKKTTGITELRVRHEANDLARIEVPLNQIALVMQPEIRGVVVEQFRELGFRCVTIDLEGFRSGSLNSILPIVQLSIAE